MSDLKLLDELLCAYMRERDLQPTDLEGDKGDSLTRDVMKRLRKAWKSGEMTIITMTWARYFEANPKPPKLWWQKVVHIPSRKIA
jgi:hypothetical protein